MVDAIGQNFIIGDPRSPSAPVRSEWLLNQIRLAVAASANPPNYTAVLSSILAAVDDLELKADQVNLTNAQINLNVDDVEALLTASNQRLLTISTNLISTLVSNLQNGTKLDSLIANANLDSATLGIMASDVAQIKVEQPIQSLALQQALAMLNVLANEISAIVSPSTQSLVNQSVQQASITQQVLDTLGNLYAFVNQPLYDEINSIQIYLGRADRPLRLDSRNVLDVGQLIAAPFDYALNTTLGSVREIVNCTGDRTGNPKFSAWVYGRFYESIGNPPPNPPSYYDHDFSVPPGSCTTLGRQGLQGFQLFAEGGGAEVGNVIINEFKTN
jgi:hypothetical protein